MSHTPVYEVTGLKHGYSDKFLLNISHLSIKSGASVGIAGPNGSGKSTLLKLLAFLEWPTVGDIYYKGRAVTKNDTGLRQNVTLLPQDPYLLKKTVFENVAYGLRMRGNKRNIKTKVHETLLLLGLVPEKFVTDAVRVKVAVVASEDTISKGSLSISGGVCQSSRLNSAPFAKKIANCPPSGPIQKRSSPPKAFMCGSISPEAINSRLIHPKLKPSAPPAVLVMTRPW